MKRTLSSATLAVAAALTLAAPAAAQETPRLLTIGDKAPALAVGAWIKGEPVSQLGHGKVTVLDFWATWCGPCIAAIPHMSELQAKYADKQVNVIGVSIWESRPSRVVPFVETRDKNETSGDEMGYRVARDDVPPLPADVEEGSPEAKANAAKGAMARTWMQAAGRNGIPTVFIIDREGVIAWIGHPFDGMDEALAKIVDGTWDLEGARRAGEREALTKQVMGQIETKLREGDYKGAFAVARANLDEALADDPYALNVIAWFIVDPEGPVEDPDLELALKAASRANELTEGKNPSILDTLARVNFELGQLEQALVLQRAAVEHSEGEMRAQLEKVLREYEEAAAKQREGAGMAR